MDQGLDLGLIGQVAIITGAAQGIGLEYARGLGKAGAKVVLADIDDAAPAALELKNDGIEAMATHTDVTCEESLGEMVQKVKQQYGRIDSLVNNAAIYGKMARKSWEDLSFEDWEPMLRVNVIGSFLTAKAVLPVMREQRKGSIVNVASGVVANAPPNMAHYNTSKAAVIGLTRSLAREAGQFNVRVNSISPGLTMSDATVKMNPEGYSAKAIARRCLQRDEEPHDLVGTVLYLCSSLSEFMSGQNLIVDGGVVFSA